MMRGRQKPHFLLSGFEIGILDTDNLSRSISKLGGVFLNSDGFHLSCTHLICKKLSRSEKFLGACASGLWILIPRYLEDCFAAKRWLPEDDYEWCERYGNKHSPMLPNCFYTAPRRNRLEVETKRQGRLADWIVAVVFKDAERKTVYERLLNSGGAKVVSCQSVLKGKGLKQVTHIFAEVSSMDRLQFALQQGVPCVSPAFLRSFLLLDNCPTWNFYEITSYDVSKDPLLQAVERQSSRPIRSARFGRILDNCMCTDHDHTCNSKRVVESECRLQQKPEPPKKERGKKRTLCSQNGQRISNQLKQSAEDVPKGRVGPMDRFLLKSPSGVAATDATSSIPVQLPGAVVSSDHDDSTSDAPPSKRAAIAKKDFHAPHALAEQKKTRPVLRTTRSNSSTNVGTSVDMLSTLTTETTASLPKLDLHPRRGGRISGEHNALPKQEALASRLCIAHPITTSEGGIQKDNDIHGVPRSVIVGAIKEFLTQIDTTKSEMSTIFDKSETAPFTPDGKKMATTACQEMSRLAVNMFNNYCSYADFEMTALQYLLKAVTKKCYPPAKAVAHVLWVILRNCNNRSVAVFGHRFLKTLLTIHPTSSTGFQLFYQQIICSRLNGGDSWDLFDGWDNIMSLLTFVETEDSTTAEERLGHQLALQFIVDVLTDDHHFSSKTFLANNSSTAPFSSLLTRLIWPSSKVGFANRSTDKFLKICIRLWNQNAVDNIEIQELSFRLMFLLAECYRLNDCNTPKLVATHHFTLGWSAEKFALDISSEILDVGVELSSVSKWMRMLQPRWLQLKVTKLLLDHLTGSIPIHHQSAAPSPMSFSSIINCLFIKPVATPLPDGMKVAYRLRNPSRTAKSDTDRVSQDINSSIKPELVNKKNVKGETPLMLACMKNNLLRVRQLLSIPDVDVNAQDNAGWSALHEACNRGHLECVKELLAYRPKRTIRGYFTKGDSLKEKGLNLLVATPDGITPLHDAVMNNRIEVVRCLLNHRGFRLLEAITANGKTPMDCTVWPKMKDVLQEFRNQSRCNLENSGDVTMEEVHPENATISADFQLLGNTFLTNPNNYNTCLVLSLHCIAGYFLETELGVLLTIIDRRLASLDKRKCSLANYSLDEESFASQLTDDVNQVYNLFRLLDHVHCHGEQKKMNKRWLSRVRLICNSPV